jgi:hypothetical protein
LPIRVLGDGEKFKNDKRVHVAAGFVFAALDLALY